MATCKEKVVLKRDQGIVASIEEDTLVVLYYCSVSEIWLDTGVVL